MRNAPFRGWIFYDGACGLCSTLREKWGHIVEPRGFQLAALQEPWVQLRLGLDGKIPEEMKFETPEGNILGGTDALTAIARHVWWAWPLWLMGQVPLVRGLLRALYRPFARRRHQVSRACGLRPLPMPDAFAGKWLD